MIEIRPDLLPTYRSLCYNGLQFPEPHDTTQLEGLTYTHPVKGERLITIDREVLAAQGVLYASDLALQAALRGHGIAAESPEAAVEFLESQLQGDQEAWAFSGFATGGFDPDTRKPYSYQSEADGLLALYEHLVEIGQLPKMTFDGGVNEGFLPLQALVARSLRIPTTGFIPKQGLGSVGIRDHMIIGGETYQDREALVATADRLVCAGGVGGTIRECVKAVRKGVPVLIMGNKEYPAESLPNMYRQDEELDRAFRTGRLIMCGTIKEIPGAVDDLFQVDATRRRPERVEVIRELLSHNR